MNILALGKTAPLWGLIAMVLGVFVSLTTQKALMVPVPEQKPAFSGPSMASASLFQVPIPNQKPAFLDASMHDATPKTIPFKLPKLFSLSVLKPQEGDYYELSAAQSDLYREIFKLQSRGNFDEANVLIQRLKDHRLLGHVLYQRYMHDEYVSSPEELTDWVLQYSDHPSAYKIHELALKKGVAESDIEKPQTSVTLARVREPTIASPKFYRPISERTKAENKKVFDLKRKIEELIRSQNTEQALSYFEEDDAKKYMDNVEQDRVYADIASSYLYALDFEKAELFAKASLERSGAKVPKAGWVLGLVQWHKKEFASAAHSFDLVGSSAYSSGWLASAGSYWASRAYKQAGQHIAALEAKTRAAKHPYTFYGIIAAHENGSFNNFKWDIPEFTSEHEELIGSHPSGRRAMSLASVGQYDLAEGELMRLDYDQVPGLYEAVLAFTDYIGLPGVAIRLGSIVKDKNGRHYDRALYPVTRWVPEGGYKVDPSLIQAIIRQESRFDHDAKSYSGAIGLMQIMPRTAQYVASKKSYRGYLNAEKLKMPETNMRIGQDYLKYLLSSRQINGDLVSMLVAYNAGPGNLQKWRARIDAQDDPLLFVEMLPIEETRSYVERVMANYWIYRLREGKSVPTLTAMASGRTPKYAMANTDTYMLAAR
ncbi:MAG: transglycosylase SLT domain-containing protein [Alphaproteobacteria bacterium]|nr:transglycosylase SLT domain-containing protein [Alphaproteobacteria bacterium]